MSPEAQRKAFKELLQPYLTKHRASLPNYLEDANAAMDLCDVMAGQRWNCDLNQGLNRTWECIFRRPQPRRSHLRGVPEGYGQVGAGTGGH